MATILKAGEYDPTNLASVAYHFARREDDAPILALLEAGADPNTGYGLGKNTALNWAVQFDRPLVVRALLAAGADPNRIGTWNATPLMSAKSPEIAHLLLAAGVDVDAVLTSNRRGLGIGTSALMVAANQDKRDVASVLLTYEADIHLRDEKGRNALMVAVQAEKSEMIRLLLEAGTKVGLAEAVLLGDYDQTEALLAAALNPEEVANALQWAVQSENPQVVALLLDHGAPLDARDFNHRTALMQAARCGRLTTMRLLLERGADPNAADHAGGTALMESVDWDNRRNNEAVELLLAYGARANARNSNGWTPLMLPCLYGETVAVELLLQHGADPNVFTDAKAMERAEGCSTTNALMLAIGNGHVEAVKLLLQHGADPLAKNNADICAMDCVKNTRKYKLEERQQILSHLEASMHD